MRCDSSRYWSGFDAGGEVAQVASRGRWSCGWEVGVAEGEEGEGFGADIAGDGGGSATGAQGEESFVVGVEVEKSGEEGRGED